MERPLLVYTTFPDAASALSIGEALVRERLIACINVLPGMRSVYSWKGAVELVKGLRKVGSAYPLVVVVLPDVPESHRRILISEGCLVREVQPIYPPAENQTQQLAMADASYDAINYSKLRIWEVNN